MTNLRARHLRNHPTEAESLLWQHLRRSQVLGRKFRRQEPIGPYIVDFLCFDPMLVIEIDGSQHTGLIAYDAERSFAHPLTPSRREAQGSPHIL